MKLAKYISKSFLKIEGEKPLSFALRKLRENSEFDCVVVDENDNYLGVLSLLSLLDKRIDGDEKIRNLIITPKTLTSSSDEDDAINAIVSSEISIVPLLDRNKVAAVVPYYTILRFLYSQKVFDNIYVENVIEKDAPSFSLSDSLESAVEIAKNLKYFTYPVVDVHGKLYSSVKIYELIDYLRLRPQSVNIGRITSNEFYKFSETTSLKVIIEKLINKLDDAIIVTNEGYPVGILNIYKLLRKAVSSKIEGNITITLSGDKDPALSMYLYSEIKRREEFLTKVGNIRELQLVIKKVHGDRYEIDLKALTQDGKVLPSHGEGFRKDMIISDLLEKLEMLIEKERQK